MVRPPLSLALGTALALGTLGAGTPASLGRSAAPAPANCAFQLGFRTLHDMLPGTVGDCVTEEYHNPDNGDGLQQATGGLLAWRKADNWTAFTDGATTWINGPNGVQSRPNDRRFPWEADGPASAPNSGGVATASSPSAYYVSPDGDDANDGSLERPWRTPQRAADVAPAGSTVYLRDGTYPGFTVRRAGLAFDAFGGESPTLAGGQDVVRIESAPGVAIRHLTVSGARGAGVAVSESPDAVVEGNAVRENTMYGIRVADSPGTLVR